MQLFSNPVTTLHTYLPMKMEQNVPKRRHIKFRRRGITQKKAYNKYKGLFVHAVKAYGRNGGIAPLILHLGN